MTLRTSHLIEESLATLHILLVEVTCCRHSQSAMPYHEVVVVFIAHLLTKRHEVVLEHLASCLVVFRQVEKQLHTLLDALFRAVTIVRMEYRETALAMLLNILYHLRVFALCLCPCSSRIGIEIVAVASVDVGDIPDGVGTRTVLQRCTCHSIRELLDALRAVGKGIPSRCCPVVGTCIPHAWVELCTMRSLQLILRLHVVLVDGIEETRTINTDG